MRTVIILALVSACLCSEEPKSGIGNSAAICLANNKDQINCENPIPNKYAKDEKCLEKTLKGLTAVRTSFGCVFCKYLNDQVAMKEQFYAQAKEDLRNFTACLGCTLNPSLTGVGFTTGAVAGEILHLFAIILETAGLSRLAASVVCTVLYPVFFSQCLDKLVEEDTQDLIEYLTKTACAAEKDKKAASVIVNTLVHTGCISKDVLGSDEVEKLISFVSSLGQQYVDGLLGKLQANLGIVDILAGLTCTVINVLGDITNGGLLGPNI